MFEQEDRLTVRLSEAARLLDVSTTTVAKLIAAGKLSSFRVGRYRLIPVEDLKRFVKESEK